MVPDLKYKFQMIYLMEASAIEWKPKHDLNMKIIMVAQILVEIYVQPFLKYLF